MKHLVAALALLCLSSTVLAHDIYLAEPWHVDLRNLMHALLCRSSRDAELFRDPALINETRELRQLTPRARSGGCSTRVHASPRSRPSLSLQPVIAIPLRHCSPVPMAALGTRADVIW
jgi:hypothetical protein